MNDRTTVTDMMEAYSLDAVEMAEANFGETLDFSEESVQVVERLLGRLHETIPRGFFGKLLGRGPSPEEIETVAKMFGGYIGEVYRKRHGGEWTIDDSIPGAGGPVITLQQSNGGRFFPTAKVFKRLTEGTEDNVWMFYRVLTTDLAKESEQQ